MAHTDSTLKTPVPQRMTTIGDAKAATQEARRILDQLLIRVSSMTQEDRGVLAGALKHASDELALAAQRVQQGKIPGELAGAPSSLALMACLVTLMPGNNDLRLRFRAFVNEVEKMA